MEDQSRPLLPLWVGPGYGARGLLSLTHSCSPCPPSPLSLSLPLWPRPLLPDGLGGAPCSTGAQHCLTAPPPVARSSPLLGGHPSCTSLVPGPAWHPACELGRLRAFRAPYHRAPSAGPACGDPGLSQSLEAFNNLSQSLHLNHPSLPALDTFVLSLEGLILRPEHPPSMACSPWESWTAALLLGHYPVAAAEGARIQVRLPCLPGPGTNSDSGQQTSCCATGGWAQHLGREGGDKILPWGGPSFGARGAEQSLGCKLCKARAGELLLGSGSGVPQS